MLLMVIVKGSLKEREPKEVRMTNKPAYTIRLSLGLGVMPGVRPRLAIGLPSISCRSAVKSIGLASLM